MPTRSHTVPAPCPPQAFVDFEVAEHAAAAVAQRHGTTITTAAGMSRLSVQPASKAEWEAAVAARQGGDGVVRLKGLPTRATAADVLAFFEASPAPLAGGSFGAGGGGAHDWAGGSEWRVAVLAHAAMPWAFVPLPLTPAACRLPPFNTRRATASSWAACTCRCTARAGTPRRRWSSLRAGRRRRARW